MGTLHISDADLARDPYAILAKVEEGVEVIVERNHRPVATIKTPGVPDAPSPNASLPLGPAARRSSWTTASARTSRTGLESAANHGIPPPGTDPRFKRNHRSGTKTADGGRSAKSVAQAFGEVEIAISAVTLAELVHGVTRANTPEIRRVVAAFLDDLKKHVPVHPVAASTAEIAGQISGEQAAKGITASW